MISKNTPTIGDQPFEELKQSNEFDAEYWSARDLQPLLGYTQWRRFEDAIKRAITSCEKSENNPEHHFAGASKTIGVGKGGAREVDDDQLSRDDLRFARHLARIWCFLYTLLQQHPPRLSTMRTRGVTFSGVVFHSKPPAKPLDDTRFGGLLMAGVCP